MTDYTFLGNTPENYLWFAGILAAGLLLRKVISQYFSRLLFVSIKKQMGGVGVEKFLELLTQPMSLLVLLITLYLAFDRLNYPPEWELAPGHVFGLRLVTLRLFDVAMIVSISWVVLRLIDFAAVVFLRRALAVHARTETQFIFFAKEVAKALVVLASLIVSIAVGFNLDVVSLITGLGIGGLALALAAKETLENLLASFIIFIDKPFRVGDNIKTGSLEGTVESIGIRTTRIRAEDKTLVTVPNRKMVDTELTNHADRQQRRVQFSMSLTNDAGASQMSAVTQDIRKLLDSHALIDKNFHVYFRYFSAGAFEIFIQYFIIQPDIRHFLEVNEEINLKILDAVKAHGCRFYTPSAAAQ